ncbi:MAG: UvrD-helicase domain-containing protein [Bacteroidaceae bacterium]|nr:UvrD-helicase domain-containing protein [Bacteroidaceae bacterium]
MNLDYRQELNPAQLEAVEYFDGPLLIIAGAGSGKTRVLTYKIAYMLQNGFKPWNILALTFTNKAAREMNERIDQLVEKDITSKMWSGTFHSIFARILRKEAPRLGYTRDFIIYDDGDSQTLVKHIIKELGLDDKVYKPSKILGRISDAKNRLMLPDAYENDGYAAEQNQRANIPHVPRIYKLYAARCKQMNVMDFDDLLLNMYLILRNFPEVCQFYSERFRYILVDEYQDTNYAQHQIICQLTQLHHNVCVVGDDAQSIYSFRGANIDNILGFQKQYPELKIVKLERNYRSTQNIVNAANSVIAHNKRQIQKTIYSENVEGKRLKILSSYSDKEEAMKVAKMIQNACRYDHVSPEEVAVLYRTNAQSRVLEESMRDMGIPYRVYGNLMFYQRKEIKDMLAYFRLVVNPADDEAFRRVVNYPARGIGNTTLSKLIDAAVVKGVSMYEISGHPSDFGVDISAATAKKLQQFHDLIELYRQQSLSGMNAYELACEIFYGSGIAEDLKSDLSIENQSRLENIQELLNSVQVYQDEQREERGIENITLAEYLGQAVLQTDADKKEDDNTERVTLMTVHAAKGLEFHTVFITGMEDGLFPTSNALLNPREMEEERRLFYVAITRAKEQCILSHADNRYKFGKPEFMAPSPFLSEIDSRFVEQGAPAKPASSISRLLSKPLPLFKKENNNQNKFNINALLDREQNKKPMETKFADFRRLTPIEKSSSHTTAVSEITFKGLKLRVGSRVRHDRFGEGSIKRLELAGDSSKATIVFEHTGEKTLLLKFAQLELI